MVPERNRDEPLENDERVAPHGLSGKPPLSISEATGADRRFIPSCAIAGGLSLEDHIFKAIALAAPYIKPSAWVAPP